MESSLDVEWFPLTVKCLRIHTNTCMCSVVIDEGSLKKKKEKCMFLLSCMCAWIYLPLNTLSIVSLIYAHLYSKLYRLWTHISYKIGCASNEDSDQPAHPRGLTRVFAVRLNRLGSLSAQRMPANTLIRLCGCAGWPVSLLGPHTIL